MGFWNNFHEFIEGSYDKYTINAHETVERMRQRVRSKYGTDRDIVRPKEAEELKFCISAMNERGGLELHKRALAMWQVFKALYPEWITDADKPKFVKECWKDLPDTHQ